VTIPILELGSICVELGSRNNELFARLGTWVISTADPELQRLFATACHRHAWHAELWEQRTPRIVGVDFESAANAQAAELVGDGDRRGWYRQQLVEIDELLTQLAGQCDPMLDPSTARTLQLVTADIADLQSRLAA